MASFDTLLGWTKPSESFWVKLEEKPQGDVRLYLPISVWIPVP